MILPLVSVLIPSYNAGTYLKQAVESIYNQSYNKLEIIIIDDGSTDGSTDFLLNCNDLRLRVFHQSNQGKASALNNALKIINGEFWLIQDADDLSYPDRVRLQLKELLKHQELAAVFSGHDLLLDKTKFAPSFSPLNKSQCKIEINNFRVPAHDATGMYRTKFVNSISFDPDLKIGQGLDFIFKVGERHPVSRLGACLYTYRINYQSTIRKQPEKNVVWINSVMEKARIRRGISKRLTISNKDLSDKTHIRAKNNHIVSHCIKSIIDYKKHNQLWYSLTVGFFCLRIEPRDYYFYKPLCFSIIPLCLIDLYRHLKKMIAISTTKANF